MMTQERNRLNSQKIDHLWKYLKVDEKQKQILELEEQMSARILGRQ